MTSNLGAKALHKNSSELGFLAPKKSESSTNQSNSIDFKEAKKSVMDAVKRHFRPEFLNRIDEMIVFRPLTEEDLKHIVSILMSDVTKRLKELQLEITSEAMQLLVKEGSDFTMGARPLKRAIQRLIEDPVSDLILKGDVTEGKTIKVDVKDNEIVVSV
jgi:ATP-dependent Clp protease ATP-binding subunit ClpC